MTVDKFLEIMNRDQTTTWEGDNAYKGLQIIAKYTDNIVAGASHDVLYSEGVETLVEGGITEEDVEMLKSLNWMVEGDDYLACFV